MKKTGLRFLKYALAGVLLLPSLSNLVFAEGESGTAAGEGETVTEKEETGETGGGTATGASGEVSRIKDLLNADCSLTFTLPSGFDETAEATEKDQLTGTANGVLIVSLYKVADIEAEDGYDSYHYKDIKVDSLKTKLDSYAHLKAEMDTTDKWIAAAEEAAKSLSSLTKVTQQADKTNKFVASGIKPGLYLVVAHDAEHTDLNEDNLGVANTKKYEYRFLPQLISLPTPEDDNVLNIAGWNVDAEDGVKQDPRSVDPAYQTSDGAGNGWTADMTAMLKPERSQRFGDLIIKKTVSSYLEGKSATFVFDIQSTEKDEDGKPVYANIASITFTDKGGQRQTKLTHIPVGTEVVVTEITAASTGYKLDGMNPADGKVTIVAEDDGTVEVTFDNSRDDHKIIYGYGVENKIAYSEDGGWQPVAGLDHSETVTAQQETGTED